MNAVFVPVVGTVYVEEVVGVEKLVVYDRYEAVWKT